MTKPKVATERLFFNEDKTRLVSEGSPEARSLAAGVGDEIPEGFTVEGGSERGGGDVEATSAGSAKAAGAATETGSEPDAAAKQTDKASDKAVKAHADKSAGG